MHYQCCLERSFFFVKIRKKLLQTVFNLYHEQKIWRCNAVCRQWLAFCTCHIHAQATKVVRPKYMQIKILNIIKTTQSKFFGYDVIKVKVKFAFITYITYVQYIHILFYSFLRIFANSCTLLQTHDSSRSIVLHGFYVRFTQYWCYIHQMAIWIFAKRIPMYKDTV